MHIAAYRDMAAAGGQVLTDGEHVDVVVAHVLHHLQNFFISFAKAHHQAALGGHVGKQGLELLEQVQAECVVATGAGFFVEARHGL